MKHNLAKLRSVLLMLSTASVLFATTQLFAFYQELSCHSAVQGMGYQVSLAYKPTLPGIYHVKLKMWEQISTFSVLNKMVDGLLEDDIDYTIDLFPVVALPFFGLSVDDGHNRNFRFNLQNNKSAVTMKITDLGHTTEVAFNKCTQTLREGNLGD